MIIKFSSLKFFIYLGAKLSSHWLITESAGIKTTTKHAQGQNKQRKITE
jgi:hypothetical protein